MDEELWAFNHTDTRDVVPLPSGVKSLSCKWIYKMKTRSNGSVERYKARLMVRGFAQEYVIDFEETLAPIVKITFIILLLLLLLPVNGLCIRWMLRMSFLMVTYLR